jgi:tRNA-specific 2-thiouridylase
VGQAKRLGQAAQAGGERHVVVALDAARRRVVVGPRASGISLLSLREVHWLTDPAELRCTVKLRARQAAQPALVTPAPDGAQVRLDAPALAAPGQACVFYEGERVLGGGFIRPTAYAVAG